jgi:hypothetical protein
VDAWVIAGAFGAQTGLMYGDSGTGQLQGYEIYFDSGHHLSLGILDGTSNAQFPTAWVASSTPVPVAQWTHVAASYDGLTMNVYVNGVLSGTSTYAYAAPSLYYPMSPSFGIGADASFSDATFNGQIATVHYYNDYVLTPSDVLNNCRFYEYRFGSGICQGTAPAGPPP